MRGNSCVIVGVILWLALLASCATAPPAEESGAALSTEGKTVETPAMDLSGTWMGSLSAGGANLRVVFRISRSESGEWTAVMDSPDQGATGIPVQEVVLEGTALQIEMPNIGSRYVGEVHPQHRRITGRWMQGGAELALDLEPAAEEEVGMEVRPQDPVPPFPYDEVEVVFQNEAEGFSLAGTLTLPRTDEKVPAVVLISGSGAQNRDEEVYNHRPFLVLADHLTRQGIAVLRCDDRGVGGSGGDRATATAESFAADTWAAVQYLLQAHGDRVDPSWIGLVGHSEGGLVAPYVAADHGEIAFVVLLAAPGLPGDELTVLQQEALMRAYGVDDEQIQAISEASRRIYRTIIEESDRRTAEKTIRELSKSFGKSDEAIDAEMEIYFSKWYRFFLSYDPAPTLARLTCPVLALRGSLDLQVTAENHVAIEEALAAGSASSHTVMELEGLNHMFQNAQSGRLEEYAQIEETFAPVALEVVSTWILEVVGGQ